MNKAQVARIARRGFLKCLPLIKGNWKEGGTELFKLALGESLSSSEREKAVALLIREEERFKGSSYEGAKQRRRAINLLKEAL